MNNKASKTLEKMMGRDKTLPNGTNPFSFIGVNVATKNPLWLNRDILEEYNRSNGLVSKNFGVVTSLEFFQNPEMHTTNEWVGLDRNIKANPCNNDNRYQQPEVHEYVTIA